MKELLIVWIMILFLGGSVYAANEQRPVYQHISADFESPAADLDGRMILEERFLN